MRLSTLLSTVLLLVFTGALQLGTAQETSFFTTECSTDITITENCPTTRDFTIPVSGMGTMGVGNFGIVEAFFDIGGFFGTITLVSPDGQEFILASSEEGITSFPDHGSGLLRVAFRDCQSLPYHNDFLGQNPDGGTYRPFQNFTSLNDGVTSADGDWTMKMCGLPDDFTSFCSRITFGPICPELDFSIVPSTCNTQDGGIDFTPTLGACSNLLVNIDGGQWESGITGWFTFPGEYTVCWGEEIIPSIVPAITCQQCTTLVVPSIDNEPPVFTDCPDDQIVFVDEFCQGQITLIDPTPTDNCGITGGTATLVDPTGLTVFSVPLASGTDFTYSLFILGEYLFTFTAEDEGGNMVTCETEVTLIDATLPSWTGSNVFTVVGECGVDDEQDLLDSQTALFVNNITDNCSTAESISYIFLESSTTVICGSSTETTYEYMIVDESGNVGLLPGVVQITMEDNIAPVLAGVPSDMTINCNDVFPDMPNVTAFDLCEGEVSIETTALSDFGSCGLGDNTEVITYTFTSTDGCNNSVSADWQITIFNDEAVSLGPDIQACEGFSETLTASGLGGTYLWSTGATTQSITVNTSDIYSCTVTGTSGCCSIDDVLVTFDPVPTATAAGGTLDCSGNPVQIMADSDLPGSTFDWTGPGGFTSTNQNPLVSQEGTYQVVVTGPSGVCIDIADAVVEANTDVPNISTSGGTIDCTNSEVTLTGTSSTPGVTYLWSGPNGFTSTEQNPTVTAAGTYDLTITAPNSCVAEGVAVVNEDTNVPSLSVSGGEINCDNTDITITPDTDDPDATFAWTGPGGFTSSMTEITVTAPGDYNLMITSANGCTNSAEATVTENVAVPTLAVSGENITCTTPDAQLTATSTTSGVTYLWSGPNGYTATIPNPTASIAGAYTVVVEATNGCTATESITVAADTAPPAITTGNDEINCNDTEVPLPLTITGTNVTIAWTGPEGFTSTMQNPTVSTAGDYAVVVTAANGCTSTATATVSENITTPNATATGGSLTCTTNSVQLMGASTTGGVSYSWTGPNDFTSTIANPTVGAAGTYILTVTAPNGCTTTATAEVTADGDLPNISATGGSLTCTMSSVTLAGSSTTSDVTYAWTGPGGFESTDQSTTVSTGGIYTLVVTAPNGCQSTTQLTVANDTDAPVVTTMGGMLSCTVTNTTISATSATAASYAWTGPGGFTSMEASPEVSQAGEYVVTVTGTNGCTSTATVTVTSNDQLPSVVAIGGTLTCENTSVILTASSSDQVTYSWTGPGGFTSTMQNPIVMLPGDYVLTVTAANGCSASTTVSVDQDADLPVIAIEEPTVDCVAGTATLTVVSEDDLTYRWTFDGTVISTGEVVTVSEAGTYEVLAISSNGCEVNLTYELVQSIGGLEADIAVTEATATAGGTAEITLSGTVVSIVWDNGDTGTMATNLTAGDHTVTVTDIYGCEYTFDFTINMSTSTTDIADITDYQVYPTLTQTTTTLAASFASAQSGQILLYGLDGRLLHSESFTNQMALSHTADLSNMPSGTYILALTVNGKVKTTKLLKY